MRAGWVVLLLLAFGGPAQAQEKWTQVPNTMTDARWAPAACVLPGGKEALVVGGYSYLRKRCVASADRFDETRGVFVPCKSRLAYPRDFAQANVLPDGTVLITGGFNDALASLDIAEIYDPKTDRFTLARGRMDYARELFQATTLADGRVLLTGGLDLWIGHTTNTAEIYDPATGQFALTEGSMADDRFGHAACRLADGQVLVVGGTSWTIGHADKVLASAEIFDPATGRFTRAGDMAVGRDRPTATLLPDSRVLVAGGQGPGGQAIDFAEIFDPASGKFTTVASPQGPPRMAHGASTLPNGDVVLAGGWSAPAKASTASAVLFDPDSQTFSPLPDLPFAALDSGQVSFPDGETLVAGGKNVVRNKATSLALGAVLEPSSAGADSGQGSIVAPGSRLTRLAGGYAFTEGPACDDRGDVYFTDQPNDRIMKWNARTGEISTFLSPCGRANGLCFDSHGALWACADEHNQLWRIDPDGRATAVATQYKGKLLNGPNDVWVRPNGGVYITDPYYPRPYWKRGPKEQPCEGVYYLPPNSEKLTLVISDMNKPNGIIGTLDGKTLYVSDIGAGQTFAYDIQSDGSLAHKRLFCPMGSDGMTIDSAGDIYCCGHGVTVFDRTGRQILQIPIAENWTGNVCFGGKDRHTLFITASTSVYTLKMAVHGVGSQ